ncbi:MAG: hypothetical protein HUJ28_08750 [Chromatiales bacterium]|nr:hypothetical protein [Chromatiales bacterium]
MYRRLFQIAIALLLLLAGSVSADVLLQGSQHIGDDDDLAGTFQPADPVYRDRHIAYPSRFELTTTTTITAVELQGLVWEQQSRATLQVRINGALQGTGGQGANNVVLDAALTLPAGVHSLSVDAGCLNNGGQSVDCSAGSARSENDISFTGIRLISAETSTSINLNRRRHVGDNADPGTGGFFCQVFGVGCTPDFYDRTAGEQPNYYPDATEGNSIDIPFTVNVGGVASVVTFYEVREVDASLNVLIDGASIGSINADGTVVLPTNRVLSAGAHVLTVESTLAGTGDYDDVSWDDIIISVDTVELSYFEIDVGAGNASTCFPREIAISARDALGNVVTDYTGTVTLATSSGHGDWLPGGSDPALGVLDNGAGDDGVASYTFDANDDGSITLLLSNSHADNLAVTVTDAGAAVSSTSAVVAFRDNAFVITPQTCTGASCAVPAGSAEVVAGRPHAFEAAVWRRDATSGDCAIATGYAGNQALKLWRNLDAQDPGGAAPTVGGAVLPTATPAATNVTVNFTNGLGSFVLDTTDVGRYDLALLDDASGFAVDENGNPRPIEGGSPTLTVRPFALGYPAIAAGALPNPGGTATTGAGFVAAGDAFELTLGAYRWQAGDDADNNGLPDTGVDVTDNGITPAFAWDVQQTALLDTPASGTAGVLGGDVTVAATGFAGGAIDASVRYSEVGSLRIDALANGYLGSGVAVTGRSPVIGRVYPADFELQGGSLTPGCAGAYTYMDQPALGIAYTLAARNRAGQVTVNYAGDPADAGRPYNVGTVAFAAENDDDGIDRAPRLFAAPGATWAAGILDVSDPAARFARLADPDGPFEDLVIGLRVADPDGVVVAAPDMNPVTTGDCTLDGSCDARAIDTTALRYGRLEAANVAGSEAATLTMPVRSRYFLNGAFVTSTQDACTTLAVSDLVLSNAAASDVRSGTIAIGGGSTSVSLVNPTAVAGVLDAAFTAPGPGNTGYVDVFIDLSTATGADAPWLAYDWDNNPLTPDEGPRARATFGVYPGNEGQIYLREEY